MSENNNMSDALVYHEAPRPGKIATEITKPTNTQNDLALAYSPGVAEPVKEIAKNPDDVYRYTGKGNLVGVISNGTAVLGLGNVGALASKPVMEGKGVLLKRFGDVDVFDIEIQTQDKDEFIQTVKNIAPTFGGINLEDIKAPECFEIENTLKEILDIPVFHDDQHGTAIVVAAGLLNALTIQDKSLDKVKIVCVGAGAAGIATMNFLVDLGACRNNIMMIDTKGVIHSERSDLNIYKQAFAIKTDKRTLEDAMDGADVFVGLSGPDIISEQMLLSMAKDPIVFALSNPKPEISPELAFKTRQDLIMATGRSDYPNQVNNVVCFPFLFRGALDVRASTINKEMMIAATESIANLAKQPIPEDVKKAYDGKIEELSFGPNYILPKPLDPRLKEVVSKAVAEAAINSGVARQGNKSKHVQETENISDRGW